MDREISKEQLNALAEKWLQGTLTAEERAIFESWYNKQETGDVQWPGNETEQELQNRIYNNINRLKNDGGTGKLTSMHQWWRVAAAALVLLSAGLAWYMITARQKTTTPAVATIEPRVNGSADKATGFIRHLTLPDGTSVVLQANSRLNYPENFIGNTREVILCGEAFFDVAHNPQKPFIIHTGRIRTTVLGTAFNISAPVDGKQITVAVTRGKVKVENEQKLLAVLTPNQKVSYEPVTEAVSKDTVNANSLVTDWTKQDMVFEGRSFEDVAALLGRRYGVDIRFKREGLKKCTIKAFFSGTETLNKVLEVLCIINNATYSFTDNKTVLLDGAGCSE